MNNQTGMFATPSCYSYHDNRLHCMVAPELSYSMRHFNRSNADIEALIHEPPTVGRK